MRRLRVTGIVVFVMALALSAFAAPAAMAKKPEKVTICHAAGLENEPANWVTLTIAYAAVYGPGGHFNENGTTQAGHEQDYLGPCEGDEAPPDTFSICHANEDGTFTKVEGTAEELAEHDQHAADVDPDAAGACPAPEEEEEEPPVEEVDDPDDDVLGERIDKPAAEEPAVVEGRALPFTGLDPAPFLALASLLAASGASALVIARRK